MRVGIFGGSFDPVHFGHLLLAESAREQCPLDAVRFLPAADPPHKQGQLQASAEDRAMMLELAIAGYEPFSVCRYEIDRGGVSYTVETLTRLRAVEPDAELFFLLGADMLHDLPHWRQAARICELSVPVAVRRAGVGEPDFGCLAEIASAERIGYFRRHQVEMPAVDLASTDLRRRVAQGRSIRYRTPRAVEEYIRSHGLYRGE